MAQGKNNAAIASALTLTVRVKKHGSAIFRKLGLSSSRTSTGGRAGLLYLEQER